MRGRKRKPVSEQELEFQYYLKLYRQDPKKEYRDQLWIRVYEACKAKLSAYYKNVPNHPYFEDRVLDSVEKVMRYILDNGVNPENLGKYVAWPVYGSAYDKKAIEIDSTISYDELIENGYDVYYEGDEYEQQNEED